MLAKSKMATKGTLVYRHEQPEIVDLERSSLGQGGMKIQGQIHVHKVTSSNLSVRIIHYLQNFLKQEVCNC